jgi:hypothetical protein
MDKLSKGKNKNNERDDVEMTHAAGNNNKSSTEQGRSRQEGV